MAVDIFSSFDDNNQVFMSLYILVWLMSISATLLFTCNYWISLYRWNALINLFYETITSQVFRSTGLSMGGFLNLITTLFVFIILVNLSGLAPYVFSCTSHLATSFSFGLPLWISLIISGAMYSFTAFVGGLLPMGAPAALNPFLVLIETVSISVRPITLSVRLMANMSAGHIVLTLAGNYMTTSLLMYQLGPAIGLIMTQVFYTIFEFGIALIQAYIFCLLLVLYSDDHPHLMSFTKFKGMPEGSPVNSSTVYRFAQPSGN